MPMNSTQYPFICEQAGERGGLMENPAVDPALFTAPTASTFTQFAALTNMTTAGFIKVKFNGVVYRIPVVTNA